MYYKFSLLNCFILIQILVRELVKATDYSASFATCPGNYQRINNGCYFIVNTTVTDLPTANSSCLTVYNVSGAVTHLIAFESQAETISLSFWFKGYKYTTDFWTDGYINSANKRVWSWSNQDYTTFGYIKDSGLSSKSNVYLRNNNTNTSEYEIVDDVPTSKRGYICEAQIPCLPADNKCFNGTCYVNSGRVLCKCYDGFQGSLCEIQVDNCESVPCLHGAECVNEINNYTCKCTEFYNGRNCENEIPFKYQDARTVALSVSVSVVGLILLILCLLDLPWNGFLNRFFGTKGKVKMPQTEINEQQNKSDEKVQREKDVPTKAQIMASEEEMLRKFKMILGQNAKSKTAIPDVN